MKKSFFIYVGVALFCGLFSTVYEHFSHGVYSGYMISLFVYPLVGGCIPAAVFAFAKKVRRPVRASADLYNAGIAALAMGSCLKGVLDIYGTSSALLPVYWIAGGALTLAGIILYFVLKGEKAATAAG